MSSKNRTSPLPYGIFNLKDSILATAHPFKILANKKGLFFDVHFADNVPEILLGSYTKIGQLIEILLDNSVKYTENGGVKINISCTFNPERTLEAILKLSVADTGKGVEDSVQDLLDSTEKSSTASGLLMAKELIQEMEGKIRLITHTNFHTLIGGPGTTFWFTIKLRVNSNEHNKSKIQLPDKSLFTKREIASNIEILVVDDNVAVRKLIGVFLEGLGYTVSYSINGNEALSKNLESFDLIFMDMEMPELNGLETTRIIRSRGFSFPIIGITASSSAENIEACLDSGMDDFMAKPVDEERLLTKVLKWTSEIKKPKERKKQASQAKKRVLIEKENPIKQEKRP